MGVQALESGDRWNLRVGSDVYLNTYHEIPHEAGPPFGLIEAETA